MAKFVGFSPFKSASTAIAPSAPERLLVLAIRFAAFIPAKTPISQFKSAPNISRPILALAARVAVLSFAVFIVAARAAVVRAAIVLFLSRPEDAFVSPFSRLVAERSAPALARRSIIRFLVAAFLLPPVAAFPRFVLPALRIAVVSLLPFRFCAPAVCAFKPLLYYNLHL